MVPLSETENEALFGRDAPLSSFSKLIRIAHAFGIIDAGIRRKCDCIREIRNAFAHSPIAVTFETPEVVNACRQLPMYYDSLPGNRDPSHPRSLYLSGCTYLMVHFAAARVIPNMKVVTDPKYG